MNTIAASIFLAIIFIILVLIWWFRYYDCEELDTDICNQNKHIAYNETRKLSSYDKYKNNSKPSN